MATDSSKKDDRPSWNDIEEWLEATKNSLSGTLTISGAVTGPLTDTQLRNSDVKITLDSEEVVTNLKAYRSSDTTYQPVRLDKATNTIQTIDYEHHEIHAGSHFFYTDKVSINSAGTQVYLITTPDTTSYAHMTFMATGSAITQVDLYEAADRVGTTAQTVFNSDRNSSTVTTLVLHKDISGGSTDGTLIWTMKSGAAAQQSRAGLTANRSSEIILKRNTKYLLRITSSTDANLTNLQLNWYEHTNIV